ncbi:NAD(P)H-dependent glycerol-3-phosphate dehydrogenase [Coxiella burnetii]|uniref:Glycerol-3-phosphate dehydrogenase [NAD(P)+] n=4 Tax=Coxiella burnetii TaxID=777 RepID=GPDA_COXBU|nr:NAD(P)H-dependent glycerol-3-phosphate dehydrogenase [Coxiella burnetii]NP_820501.1 glycerol-3-phosphate dehydrogenase (NAD(P)+) [Coxiella burnetii RSA 493]A9KF85.1 RecName: Full=Glycerol-3-phosphate dehydrogenase [NAD(P)+]; AltName: Full=NAD(P)H-dependent glycerol-3-phosphate dehydrogenase [Coxiella burnetii Dugway 5J108-111]B6IYY5.1 RecName: Full=Glycerol-3-phosphate dehydrogenase [NAD(P)+]; AltName: Full=NAD(P)H-dependent glycerol-3-phosphate dehydrogenase [Coxiella burnetii CbuG_Q212]Q83
MEPFKHPIAILGAGSWGTALALVLARKGQKVRLWSYESDHVDEMQAEGVNNRYLPNYPFPETLKAYCDLKASLEGVTDILIVVPSFAFHEVITRMKPLIDAKTRIAWGTKGLAKGSRLLHEVVATELGQVPMAVISGPSLATEVAANLPTAVSLASNNSQFSKDLIERLHGQRFRVYKNDDMIGVELCGSVKNILAIATGISDGLKLGSNARAALITRGLTEMGRLVSVFGGKQETLTGLAGLGDLVLTCTDNQSRNRRFGLALGEGVDKKEAQQAIGQAIEGLYNTDQVHALAQKHAIEMPLTFQVHRILHEDLDPQQAVQELLERSPKAE